MIAIAASIAALLLSPELPAQGTAPNDTAVWLDELDLKAMAQRRGVPEVPRHGAVMLNIGRPIATDTAN